MAQTFAADTQLTDFIRQKADTFAKWDLIRFFHNNPHAAQNAENIARTTAREPGEVEQNLNELVASGILETNSTGKSRIYQYVKNADTRSLVARFVAACDDREFREGAINLVIQGLR